MFVVMMSHNFNSCGNSVVLFEDEDVARKYLKWSWESYLKVEIAEGSDLIRSECYCSDDCEFGKVTWEDGCETEFNLSRVYEVEEDFKSYLNS